MLLGDRPEEGSAQEIARRVRGSPQGGMVCASCCWPAPHCLGTRRVTSHGVHLVPLSYPHTLLPPPPPPPNTHTHTHTHTHTRARTHTRLLTHSHYCRYCHRCHYTHARARDNKAKWQHDHPTDPQEIFKRWSKSSSGQDRFVFQQYVPSPPTHAPLLAAGCFGGQGLALALAVVACASGFWRDAGVCCTHPPPRPA